MANVFEYQSLPAGNYIRVLILTPGKGDDPLAGELKVVHLSNRTQILPRFSQTLRSATQHLRVARQSHKLRETSSKAKVARLTPDTSYEAISYVWGSDKKDHNILLSEKTHQITANLSDALHQCRFPDQSRALWADSICIDQENLDEKGHQVHMMGRIYASSERTVICLGTDPDNQDHAQAASTLVSDVNEMIQRVFRSPDFSFKANCFPQPLANDPLVTDSRWRSIEILLLAPWFRRGWIVQEAAFARESRILWAGCNIALLSLIRVDNWYHQRAVHLLERTDYRRSVRISRLLQHTLIHEYPAESKAFYRNNEVVKDPETLSTLQFARELGLTNPRDRIYAFIALPFVRNPMPDLHPNYEQSHLEVYQDFAVKYLEETSDLEILSFVESKRADEASEGTTLGSSWIPRWDDRVRERYGKTPAKFGKTSVQTSEAVILQGESGAPALLQVRAIILDSIRLCSRRFHRSMTIEDFATIWSQFIKGAGSATGQDTSSPARDSLCFLKALTGGFNNPGEDRAAALQSYASFLQTKGQEMGSQGSPPVSPEVQLCHRRLIPTTDGLRVFTLERGNFGLGPPSVEEGDICALVFGVSLPLVLRKFPGAGDGHYNVIGPAFVVSMVLDKMGLPSGLNRLYEWKHWDLLWRREGWTEGELQEERIVLH